MSEFPITAVEVKEEKPDWQGKGATIYRYTVEGDERRPEEFVVKGNQPRKVGDKVEIEDSDYGPKVKKAPRGGGGGTRQKMDPQERKQVQRQHSQEMALRHEANLGAKWTGEQLRSVINWFEADIATKDRSIQWDGFTNDVPADTTDLFPPEAA